LTGDDPAGHYAALASYAEAIGFSLEGHHFAGTCNGDCSHEARRIRVEVENSPAQRVKTLVHEIAHALLHKSYGSRPLAELEAESVAYIVCSGLGTDAYSFGYVTTWVGGSDPGTCRYQDQWRTHPAHGCRHPAGHRGA
jgi:hypothetical protein